MMELSTSNRKIQITYTGESIFLNCIYNVLDDTSFQYYAKCKNLSLKYKQYNKGGGFKTS